MPTNTDNQTSTTTKPLVPALSQALDKLRQLGVTPGSVAMVPAVNLVGELQTVDVDRATRLARVFQAEADFNELAREQTVGMAVGDAHTKIARNFDSIIEDTRAIYGHLHDDGKIDMWEKLDIARRTLVHGGSIPSRFKSVRELFLDATKRCQQQLEHEQTIIEAYNAFRAAYGEGMVDALELQQVCQQNVTTVKAQSQTVIAAWEAITDPIEKAKKNLEKNQAVEAVELADRKYQVATNLVNDMRVGQGAGDAVVEKLKQTHKAKIAVQDRAITFFGTNEHVITALCVALQSEKGLNERTQTLEELQRGTEKAMDVLAEIGTKVDKQAIEKAYGQSLSPEVVGRLVDAMVNYQKEVIELTASARAQAEESAKAIAARTQAGQEELARLAVK
ncbi:MAG TPA: hypothetical protein VF607_15835 [Verrucomicrobiae bacterium]